MKNKIKDKETMQKQNLSIYDLKCFSFKRTYIEQSQKHDNPK